MIYLLNNTDPQEIYIPKNTSGVNPHKSNSYWEGFEDGYESGETHQKNLLTSVTFTENGEYERENGWSAVTVDVPQTGSTVRLEEKTVVISADTTNVTPSSGYDGMSAVTIDASDYAQQNYDNGFDDGFTDGYSSGSTDEREKLSAVTFTANTAVTISDGGYSGITVNVPQTGHTDQELEEAYESGHTEGMEDQKALLSSTAFTENGSYSRENGWSGVTVNIDTASTYNSGYTSGYTDGQDNIIDTFSAMTATTNGQYGSSAHPLSAITVEVPQTGTSIPLSSITFTANTSVTVSDKAFTAITVNVPQSGGSGINYIEYIGINNPNRNTCYFELGNTGTGLDSKIVIEHSTLSTENAGADWENWLMFSDTERGRIFVSSTYNKIMFDGRYNNSSISVSSVTDETIILENTGVTIGGVSYNAAYNTSEVSDCNNMTVFCAYGNYFSTPSNQLKYGRIGKISIYDSANTLTYQYKPCLDENNIICFHEVVNDVYVYPNNGGDTYLYSGPIINDMYESGYTDGQNSIINTFSAMTATTNGQYGSSAHPLSSITVNVPQTGSSATLGTGSFSANGTYNASTDNLDGYSAITINVQSSGSTDLRYFIEGTYQDWPDTFNIPAGTKYIRPYCFAEYDLLDIIVPSSVTGMGEYAFYKSSIRYFKKENNCVIENIPKYAFAECHSLDADGWPVFNDVLSIDEYAFSDCNSQDFNTVSACCVTKIGIYAFNGCTGLTTVMLGGNLMSISYGAFNGCSNLRNIYMLSTTVPIGSNYAFIGIPNSGTFHYPRGSDYSSLQNLSVFSGWTFTGDL